MTQKTKSLTAENTFTDSIFVEPNEKFTVTITGSYVGTISAMAKINGTWTAIDTVTPDAEGRWNCDGGGDEWKAGFETGDYGSGTASITVSGRRVVY